MNISVFCGFRLPPSMFLKQSVTYTRRRCSGSPATFPIAILAQLLPKFLITKEVCSKLTSIVFPRIPYLVPALAQNFSMLHMAM